MRLRLSKLACDDLDSIYAYTLGIWGLGQADRYIVNRAQAMLALGWCCARILPPNQ